MNDLTDDMIRAAMAVAGMGGMNAREHWLFTQDIARLALARGAELRLCEAKLTRQRDDINRRKAEYIEMRDKKDEEIARLNARDRLVSLNVEAAEADGAEIARLRDALTPFAMTDEPTWVAALPDGDVVCGAAYNRIGIDVWRHKFTFGAMRRARAALAGETP